MVFHEPKTISVSGKGGAGKSTTTVLLLKYLLEKKLAEDVLLVDADPDANLSDMLSVPINRTVGEMSDQKSLELRGEARRDLKFRHAILESLSHGEGFDLLVMGRTKGEGCYCVVNSYLSKITESILRLYDVAVIDFDAGLEHFARRTDRIADILIIVTDPSSMGFETARRIKRLTEELDLGFRKRLIVGSKFPSTMENLFHDQCRDIGLEPGGMLPYLEEVAEWNMLGRNLLQLTWTPALIVAVEQIWENVLKQFDEDSRPHKKK